MKKRVLSMALAAAMTLSLCTFTAAADEAQTDKQDNTTVVSKGNQEVILTGVVEKNSVLISVVMPTSLDFIISTTDADGETLVAEKGDNTSTLTGTSDDTTGIFEKLYNGTGTVTNNSEAAVKLELISSKNQTGNLLNMVDLSLKATGVQDTSISNTVSLVAGKDYTVGTDGVLAASLAALKDGDVNGGQVDLQVNGAAAKGTHNGSGNYDVNIPAGEYTIQTIMKVSLA